MSARFRQSPAPDRSSRRAPDGTPALPRPSGGLARLGFGSVGLVWLAALCLAVLLVGCGGGGSGPASSTPVVSQPAGQTVRASIASRETGISYGYYVYLPAGYTPAKAYPVIYATDSEYRFTTLSGAMQATQASAILVNIDATSSARRWIDFTMPGAQAYFRFLTQELIPQVEAQYSIDPARRTFSGHSLSGEFALYALYLDNPAKRFFSSIISEEGSFWYQADMGFSTSSPTASALEQQMFATSRQLPVNLVLAGDTTSNGALVDGQVAFFSTRGYQQLRLLRLSYSLGHVPMDGPAFTAALGFILSPG